MAYLGDSKYDLSISVTYNGEKKTKNISTINYNGTGAGGGSSALGADAAALYNLGNLFADSIIGASAGLTKITLNDGREVVNG